MNYDYLHQSKKPFAQKLENSICNQTTSRILQLKSPDRMRDNLSPKLARDYLHNLKNFISNIDSRKPSYTSVTNTINTINLYFPQRQNDEIKLITPQKIELKKMSLISGQIKSLRYFYLKNPILQSVNEIIPHSIITIMGDIKSGKKKLLYDLINRMNIKQFILQIDSQDKQINVSIQNDIHQTIKDLLKTYKDKKNNIKLTVKNDKYKITCQSLGPYEGQLIICIHPPKQSIESCKKTLKYVEQNY